MVPKKWSDGHRMGDEYAFSATDGALNMAPPTIIRNFIFGTFVRATPCKQNNTATPIT